MSNMLYEEEKIRGIAQAIRRGNGQETLYTVEEMETAIDELVSGLIPTETINIINNGTYDVSNAAEAIVSVNESGVVFPSHILMGVITVNADSTELSFNYGLSIEPKKYLLVADEVYSKTGTNYTILGKTNFTSGSTGIIYSYNGGLSNMQDTKIETTFVDGVATLISTDSSYNFRTGFTYRWMLWFDPNEM